jgi:DNA-binding transcriptional LysR family regulator
LGIVEFRINVAEELAVAVRERMGHTGLPAYSAMTGLRNDELVQMLPDYISQVMNVYALYSSQHHPDAKIGTWFEFLLGELSATLTADQGDLYKIAHRRGWSCKKRASGAV